MKGTYLGARHESTGYPRGSDHSPCASSCVAHGQRAGDGQVSVHGDGCDNEPREIDSKGAEERHETTHEVSSFPRNRNGPSDLCGWKEIHYTVHLGIVHDPLSNASIY